MHHFGVKPGLISNPRARTVDSSALEENTENVCRPRQNEKGPTNRLNMADDGIQMLQRYIIGVYTIHCHKLLLLARCFARLPAGCVFVSGLGFWCRTSVVRAFARAQKTRVTATDPSSGIPLNPCHQTTSAATLTYSTSGVHALVRRHDPHLQVIEAPPQGKATHLDKLLPSSTPPTARQMERGRRSK